MNNPNDAVRKKHVDSLAHAITDYAPKPTANDADKFLRGDGTWATPTSVLILDTVPSTVEGAIWLV